MPFSSSIFDDDMGKIVALLQPATVCDIGPGAGKYARIVRNVANEHQFTSHLTAVEIDDSYVSRFDLRSLYDTVIIGDATNLMKNPQCRFDLVIFGDCIEHLKKSDGIDLLNFLIYRSGYICIVYPDSYVQDDWEGHAAEAHISVWGPQDFSGWEVLHRTRSKMHLFVIKGYQPSRVPLGV